VSAREWVRAHRVGLDQAMSALADEAPLIESWARQLQQLFARGGRVLVAGNGGSAAESQHLTAELVGRYVDERRPLSALCLSAETSSLTAILNDYGAGEVFSRQVQAHGRPGDVLLLLSTSGRSANVLAAAERGHQLGLVVWAMTGRRPNPLATVADQALAIEAADTALVQEVHLVAVHALCAALDAQLLSAEAIRARLPVDEVPA
jgi:D-sedoheptulose 7-phosphate isomerase